MDEHLPITVSGLIQEDSDGSPQPAEANKKLETSAELKSIVNKG